MSSHSNSLTENPQEQEAKLTFSRLLLRNHPPGKKKLPERFICITGPQFLLFIYNVKSTLKLNLTSNKTSDFHLRLPLLSAPEPTQCTSIASESYDCKLKLPNAQAKDQDSGRIRQQFNASRKTMAEIINCLPRTF